MRREDLLYRVPNPREALHPLTPFFELVECRLRPTAPVKQGVPVLHDFTQLAPMRQTSVMGRSRLRSLGCTCRLTHRKRSWNTSLICCWRDLRLRALRRAACSLDDGRPRFPCGVDRAKRSRSWATACNTPWVRSLIL